MNDKAQERLDKLSLESDQLSALQLKVKQKYPEHPNYALMLANRMLRRTPMGSSAFDEKKFWSELDEQIQNPPTPTGTIRKD